MLKFHYEIVSPFWFDYSIEIAEVYSSFVLDLIYFCRPLRWFSLFYGTNRNSLRHFWGIKYRLHLIKVRNERSSFYIFQIFLRVTEFAQFSRIVSYFYLHFQNLEQGTMICHRYSLLIRKSFLTNALNKCKLYHNQLPN